MCVASESRARNRERKRTGVVVEDGEPGRLGLGRSIEVVEDPEGMKEQAMSEVGVGRVRARHRETPRGTYCCALVVVARMAPSRAAATLCGEQEQEGEQQGERKRAWIGHAPALELGGNVLVGKVDEEASDGRDGGEEDDVGLELEALDGEEEVCVGGQGVRVSERVWMCGKETDRDSH
jgi:hypothetical protein